MKRSEKESSSESNFVILQLLDFLPAAKGSGQRHVVQHAGGRSLNPDPASTAQQRQHTRLPALMEGELRWTSTQPETPCLLYPSVHPSIQTAQLTPPCYTLSSIQHPPSHHTMASIQHSIGSLVSSFEHLVSGLLESVLAILRHFFNIIAGVLKGTLNISEDVLENAWKVVEGSVRLVFGEWHCPKEQQEGADAFSARRRCHATKVVHLTDTHPFPFHCSPTSQLPAHRPPRLRSLCWPHRCQPPDGRWPEDGLVGQEG